MIIWNLDLKLSSRSISMHNRFFFCIADDCLLCIKLPIYSVFSFLQDNNDKISGLYIHSNK